MSKIEVGEYVRIKDCRFGIKIAKVTKILEKDPCYKNMQIYKIDSSHKYSYGSYISHEIYKEDIIKHSSNIIDLIEVGDYVNGERVEAVDYTEDEQGNYIDVLGTMEIEDDFAYPIILRNEDINSIVTHQQFKEMEYKV